MTILNTVTIFYQKGLNKKIQNGASIKACAIFTLALLVAASPSILQNAPGKYYAKADSELVFIGATQASVLSGSSLMLDVNLTNVNPTSVSVIVQAVMANEVNNETIENQNSSAMTLLPSVPTVINMTITDLTLCTNYSISINVNSSSTGAILAAPPTIYVFPCLAYDEALTLDAAPSLVSLCPYNVCVNATFTNTLRIPVSGIAFAVFKTSVGQTAYLGMGTVQIAPGNTSSLTLIAPGLGSGVYNVTVFAWDTSGVPVSQKYSAQLSF